MDPPEETVPPHEKRRRGRGPLYLQRTFLFTTCFAILMLLKLEPLARNSVQDHNNEIDLPLPKTNEEVKDAAMKVVGDEFRREVVPQISPKLTEQSFAKQEGVLTRLDIDVSIEFCGHNKWLGSRISCTDRVSFLVNRHHNMSEQQAKMDLLEDNCQCSLVRNSTQYTDILQLQPQAPMSGSIGIGTSPYGGSRIPKTLIFVDTRYHNMTQFSRLVRENIQNTIKVYSSHWNEANISVWFLGDEQCQQVIGRQNSDLLHFYQTESFGPFKSDICRIAALNERGGYYFDNDMEVVEAMSLPNATFIAPSTPVRKLVSNTFIAATPRHVIFHEVINTMVDYYKTNRRANEKGDVGPITLWEGYEQAAKKYCGVASGIRCNTTWSIFDLSQVNLDDDKELYPTRSRRKGWGCCCNYVIHNAHLKKIYFWSRFLGSGGSCRFRGGKTADDID